MEPSSSCLYMIQSVCVRLKRSILRFEYEIMSVKWRLIIGREMSDG